MKIPFSTIDEGVDYFTEKMQEVYQSDIPAGIPEETVDKFIHALQNRALRSNSIQDFYNYGVNALERLKNIMPYKIEEDMKPRRLTPEEEAKMLERDVKVKCQYPEEETTIEDLRYIARRCNLNLNYILYK